MDSSCIHFVSLNGIPTKLVIFDDKTNNDLIEGRKFSKDRLILMISGIIIFFEYILIKFYLFSRKKI